MNKKQQKKQIISATLVKNMMSYFLRGLSPNLLNIGGGGSSPSSPHLPPPMVQTMLIAKLVLVKAIITISTCNLHLDTDV